MKLTSKHLNIAAIISILFLGIMFAFARPVSAAFRVVQTQTYHLYTGESGTATSMRITPYPVDLDGVKLTISDFGTTPTITVDPKLTGIEEIESFTSIVDNGDNTATLYGLSRNLQSKYPYTGTGTGRNHGSGATVVFGNNPQVYGRLAAPENTQTWTAIQTFSSTTMPRYDVSPSNVQWAAANGAALVNLDKLNLTAIAGAANASETTNGISQLATTIQAASSTSLGSTGGRLVLPASMATSSNDVAGLHVVVTQNSGKINWNQIDLGTAFTSTALVTFAGGFAATGASTFSATSTAATSTLMVDFDTITTVMASTTFTGFTSPQPAYIATSTGALNLADANSVFDEQFMGFAVNNATNGQQVLLQREGIVTGFTGLTKGSDYYVQDAIGTIGTTVGTAELYVGRAISTTQILIDRNRGMQYLGSQALTCQGDTVINQPYARFAKITGSTSESGSGTSGTHYMEIAKIGKTVDSWTDFANVGGSIVNNLTVTWTATSSIRSQYGGNSTGCSGTAYYYQ